MQIHKLYKELRTARTEFPTEDFLPDNPFVTASNTTLKINFPNGDLQVNDFIRLRNVKSPVGSLSISTLQLSTTLNGAITDTATTINLTDGSAFPTSGFIVIEKVFNRFKIQVDPLKSWNIPK